MFIVEEQKIIKRVNEIISRDPKLIDDTVDMIIRRGVPNGAFQDYALVSDILGLLGYVTVLAENQQNRRAKEGKSE